MPPRANPDRRRKSSPKARLRELEASYLIALEGSNDGVALIIGDKAEYVNNRLLGMLEYDRTDEVLGKSFFLAVHPEDREMVAAGLRKAEEGEPGPDRYEFRMVTKDGHTKDVEVAVSQTNHGGQPARLVFLRDISRRKEAERALRESEEKFRILFEKSTDPTMLMDGDTYIDCNEAALRFLGCPREKLLGLHPWDVSPEQQPDGSSSAERAQEQAKKALREGQTRFECVRRSFSGEEAWFDVSLSAIPVLGKHVIYAVWRNISARKQAEEALQLSKVQLSEAAELAKIVYWELDRTSGEFIINDAFYALFGTTAEREGGYRMAREKYMETFVHPDDLERVRAEIRQVEGRTTINDLAEHEHRAVRRDGSVIHILTRIRIVKDAPGQRAKIMGVNQDITDRKAMEGRLLQAEKMEAFGALSAGIAHDFTNILTAITGFANRGLDRCHDSEKAKLCFTRVLQAARRGKDLVRQILLFSRRDDDLRRPIDPVRVIKESIEMLRVSLPARVVIREDIAIVAGRIAADPTRIQQIIFNLGTNGAHAMGQSGGILTIGLAEIVLPRDDGGDPEMLPGTYIELSVGDTGAGMDPHTVAHIFDPFFTTKKHGEGTGLGLWLVQGIVKNHGGAVTVKSVPGEGTVFRVLLPTIPP